MMDRRTFLKSLFASAIATQLPSTPEATRDKLAERVAKAVRVQEYGDPDAFLFTSGRYIPRKLSNYELAALTGDPNSSSGSPVLRVTDKGDGYYEVALRSPETAYGLHMSVDTGDPNGMFCAPEWAIREYLTEHPDYLACSGGSTLLGGELRFWVRA